jgi:hypothetical protein
MVRVQPRVVQAQLASQTRLTAAKNHSETPTTRTSFIA